MKTKWGFYNFSSDIYYRDVLCFYSDCDKIYKVVELPEHLKTAHELEIEEKPDYIRKNECNFVEGFGVIAEDFEGPQCETLSSRYEIEFTPFT